MVTRKQYLIGVTTHGILLFVNFCVLLGIITNLAILVSPSTSVIFLNLILLGYMIIHTSVLLSIQLGIQVLEIIMKKPPTLLISYYFNIGDEVTIPDPFLDPIKSKLAVIIILLILSGGTVIYPIFAIYGFLLLIVRLPIILLNPTTLISYFEIFLNLVPPLLMMTVVIIVLSIIMIEFKRQ
jgi:hypothetical protein